MDLPVKFPSETEVILEDVGRSQGVTPEERVRAYRRFLTSVARIARRSPRVAWAAQHAEDQEILARVNIMEFLNRHGS